MRGPGPPGLVGGVTALWTLPKLKVLILKLPSSVAALGARGVVPTLCQPQEQHVWGGTERDLRETETRQRSSERDTVAQR